MSLRDKTLLILFVAIVALGGLLYHSTQTLFLQSYRNADNERAYGDLARLERGVYNSMRQLDSIVLTHRDLERIRSRGDSGHPYAQGAAGALQALGIEFVAIADSDANLEDVLMLGVSSSSDFEEMLREYLVPVIDAVKLIGDRPVGGIIPSGDKHYIGAFRKVAGSVDSQDDVYYVVLARRAGREYFDRLRQLSGSSGGFRPLFDPWMDADGSEPSHARRDVWIDERGDKMLVAGKTISDIFGEPSVVLEVRSPRDSAGYGIAILGYFTFFLILCGIILGCVIFFLLEKNFFAQLSRLRLRFAQAGVENVVGSGHKVQSKDEILSLSKDFDSVLAALDDAASRITGSEIRFQELFNNIKCGVEIYGIDEGSGELRLEEFNLAAEKYSGLDVHAVKGRRIDKIYPELRNTKVWAAIADVCVTGRSVNIEPEFYDCENMRGWREYQIYRLPSMKVVLLYYDVTARMQVIEALREKEVELSRSQKMEAVGRLAGGIAHDFNNILTIVNGISEILLLTMDEGDEYRQDIAEIHNAGLKAAKLTSQLLAFSRKQVLKPEVIDVGNVLADVKNMLSRVLGDNIELKIINSSGSCMVLADVGQIEQVLLNLTINARDAMPNGGYLEIDVSKKFLSSAQISKHATFEPINPKTCEYVVIKVVDNGTGMSEEVMQRLFDPFFTTKSEGRGTGLGLSTSYGIVRQSDGYMWFESKLGSGSVCTICLPHVVFGKSGSIKTPETVVPTGKETILLVEDSSDLRNLMQRFLLQVGFNVLPAAQADDAIDIDGSYAGDIDVLLTDVVMPGLNGFELFKKIRKRHPKIKVVFITGHYDDPVVIENMTRSHCLLKKPFTMLELAEMIRGEIDNHVAGVGNQ